MIRALYTAASGMNAQQMNIDNVAHNLANVNTTGFKKGRMELEDLVYQQIKAPGSPTSTEGQSPIGLDAGLGSRVTSGSPPQHRPRRRELPQYRVPLGSRVPSREFPQPVLSLIDPAQEICSVLG